ncbi:MAG: IS110 family transposase [Vicinamibacteria bacterium]|nr:IS110 family transposase [Vicinamibacteria bacterium]
MHETLVAVDLAKEVFEVAESREAGRVAATRRLNRDDFLAFFAQLPASTVVMEVCGSSHHWAREISKLGHEVRLLPPARVRPYRHRNKTDKTDAKALLEASRNEEIHPVPVKTLAQQSVGIVHRMRAAWLETRTARINTIRGLLRECGLFMPLGAQHVVPRVQGWITDDEAPLTASVRATLASACDEVVDLEVRIAQAEARLEAVARQTPLVELWLTVPGIGLLTATALYAFVGDLHRFRSARHFASYLGLTPREFSSGPSRRLGRISKRGDAYLRHLFVHGARALLGAAGRARHPDRLRKWALALAERAHFNKATCALANKIARIAWSVSTHQREYLADDA